MEYSATANVYSYFVIKLFYKHLYLLKTNGLKEREKSLQPTKPWFCGIFLLISVLSVFERKFLSWIYLFFSLLLKE